MPFDPALLEILACPSGDHAPLREESRDGADVLVCTYCESSFRLDDGIPVLLPDEATAGPCGIGVEACATPAAAEPSSRPDEEV